MTVIAIDFDGTIVEHDFPKIGAPVPGAVDWIKMFVKYGAKIVLRTCRDGSTLEAAVEYCRNAGIELYGINENPDQHWSVSPKAYASLYIDDRGAFCPLVSVDGGRPYVDWFIVGPEVLKVIAGPEVMKIINGE